MHFLEPFLFCGAFCEDVFSTKHSVVEIWRNFSQHRIILFKNCATSLESCALRVLESREYSKQKVLEALKVRFNVPKEELYLLG